MCHDCRSSHLTLDNRAKKNRKPIRTKWECCVKCKQKHHAVICKSHKPDGAFQAAKLIATNAPLYLYTSEMQAFELLDNKPSSSCGVLRMRHPCFLRQISDFDSSDLRTVVHFASRVLAQRRQWCVSIMFTCGFLFAWQSFDLHLLMAQWTELMQWYYVLRWWNLLILYQEKWFWTCSTICSFVTTFSSISCIYVAPR